MSYILEALRKSETQRRHHTTPTLRVVQEVASEAATTGESRHQPLWPWMVGAALLVNGGITLYHHLNNHNAPAISAVATAPTTNNTAATTATASIASAAHIHNHASGDTEDIPLLQSLPLEFRRRLPALSVDVLVYSNDPSERFVLVNMRKYHEGEAIDGNLFVEGITQRSVVLSFETVRFQVVARR